jgi:hypothetical protein
MQKIPPSFNQPRRHAFVEGILTEFTDIGRLPLQLVQRDAEKCVLSYAARRSRHPQHGGGGETQPRDLSDVREIILATPENV